MDKEVDAKQIGGNHYKKCPPEFQHWNLVTIHGWDYFQAQCIKYIMRYKDRGGVDDLKKASHFIAKMIGNCEADSKVAEALPPLPVPKKEEGNILDPRAYTEFAYEGGSMRYDLYTCKKCKGKIYTELGRSPRAAHECGS